MICAFLEASWTTRTFLRMVRFPFLAGIRFIMLATDRSTAATNDSSTTSKTSMSRNGYVHDPFIGHFVQGAEKRRRTPIIHRGYFIRVWIVEHLVGKFLQNQKSCQIVSLGAGFDSLFFRLRSQARLGPSVYYVEIDFPAVMNHKLNLVISRQAQLLPDSDELGCYNPVNNHAFVLPGYTLVGADLRNIEALKNSLMEANLDFSKPTLLLAECVLTYLDSQKSDAVLAGLVEWFTESVLILYEQIRPFDGFGTFMRSHFASIGSPLRTVCTYPSKESILGRMTTQGWKFVGVDTMNHFYCNVLPASEKTRIAKLEPFDEFEIWHMKCAHYVVSLATNTASLWNTLSTDFQWNIGINERRSVSKKAEGIVLEDPLCQRFAHAAAKIEVEGRKFAVLIGGFGRSISGHHCRLTSIVAFDLSSKQSNIVDIQYCGQIPDLELNRCYHCALSVGHNKIFVFGGRHSPLKPVSKNVLLSFSLSPNNGGQLVVSAELVSFTGDPLTPRWRAASCLLPNGRILVCGGLGIRDDAVIMKDCFSLDTSSGHCHKLPDLPVPLHSHSAVAREDDVLVLGGLSEIESRLSLCIWRFDFRLWTPLFTLDRKDVLGYGMSCHLGIGSQICLIGGSSYYDDWVAGIRVLSLDTHSADHLELDYHTDSPIELVNHCCVLDCGTVFMLGGGGNCFSFGTLLNSGIIIVSLR